MHPSKEVKDTSEQQELDHYDEGTLWLEEAQQEIGWIQRLQDEAQTDEERRVSNLLIMISFLFCRSNIHKSLEHQCEIKKSSVINWNGVTLF